MSFIDELLFEEYMDVVKKIKPTICIEVGAYDADFSQYIVKNNICNKVYAFEASPFVYERCRHELDNRINYINSAIMSFSGTTIFNIDNNYDPAFVGSNSMKLTTQQKSIRSIEIPCDSIDVFFKDIISHKDKVCMWVDAEGSSDEVLLGMKHMFDLQCIHSIFIETEHQKFWQKSWMHTEVDKYLNSVGMKKTQSKFQYVGQTNCIYEKS